MFRAHGYLSSFDVRPFTMSGTLLPVLGYYGLCWLLSSHHSDCSEWRCISCFLSGLLCFVSHQRGLPFHHRCRDIWEPVAPAGIFTGNNIMPHEKQASPDKSVNFRCTTAPFTVSPVPWALTCCAVLPGDSALYGISVRRPTSLPSASFRPHLTVTPLPSASTSCYYFNSIGTRTGDLNPISSRPCRAYTNSSSGQFKAALVLHSQKRATLSCRWAWRWTEPLARKKHCYR